MIIYKKKVISLVIIKTKSTEIPEILNCFRSCEFGKNIISKISGRLLIGQNDTLGVLLLVDISIEYKKGRNELTNSFGH